MIPALISRSAPSRTASFGVRLVAALALMLPVAGCSTLESFSLFGGDKYQTKILPDIPADDIYNQGLARLEKKDYEGAAKKFAEMEKQHPYSQWSKKALIMTAFAHYQARSYTEAISAANRYASLYSNTPDTAYAYYLGAMSYYNQIPDISRDQDNADRALNLFNQIITKFPKSEYAEDAKYKVQVTKDQLAGKEMSVGRFYLTRRQYTAAINRFRDVLGKYQTTRHSEEALMRLTEAYLGLGIVHEAQTAAAVLGHNYPDSPWYKDAFERLKGSGLAPHESEGSWISKAFRKVTG